LSYVSDIVDGLIRHMNSPIDVTVVNLGSDQDALLSSVAAQVIKLTDSASRVRFEPTQNRPTEAGLPDIGKARQVLGWLPLVRLEDGLRRMIDYSRAQRQLTPHFGS
ncbi:MAG: SDR family NAD-dependent epimerase/dehydratase, partial [Candidatus Uhrbacteria bacterium]|nr:SDR family NAD-dependent epimerase/dehydratase [Candidatus Uhrbacteria bacterium]